MELICPICESRGEALGVSMPCSLCGFAGSETSSGVFKVGFDLKEIEYPEEANQLFFEFEDSSFWFRHRNEVILSLVGLFRPSGTLIDVGGGNGFQALKLQDFHSRTLLLEPGENGCLNARKRGVKNIVNSTLQALQLKTGVVKGGLAFFDVLEHLDEPVEILTESFRILSGDGLIYVSVPAFDILWSHEDIYARHKRRYNLEGLKAELISVGFKVEFISYYFAPLFLPIFLLRCIPFRLGFSKVNVSDSNDHKAKGLILRVVDWLLNRELDSIKKLKRAWFGSSIICVARKPLCQ
jgi:SAM-dependent methyltransferase